MIAIGLGEAADGVMVDDRRPLTALEQRAEVEARRLLETLRTLDADVNGSSGDREAVRDAVAYAERILACLNDVGRPDSGDPS